MTEREVDENLKKMKALLAIEKEEDYVQYREQFLKADIEQRRKNGLTWYPVKINNQETGFGEYIHIEVERTSYPNQPHQFSSGKNVTFFTNNNNEIQELGGTIKSVHRNSMSIVLNADEMPDWAYDGKLGINAQFDDNSYREMDEAMKKVIEAKEGRVFELKQILYGVVAAQFEKTGESLVIANLNLSQNRAVRKAIAAKDVAIIHGPPGTGKTTTLVQAIRLALTSEKQVLVCAPTNVAVDLLTERLTQQGISVLRLGHPARITPDLFKSTLDGKMQEHISYKEIKLLRRNAEEYFRMAGKYKRVFGKEDAQQRALFYTEAKKCVKEARLLEDYIYDSLYENAQVITCTPVTTTGRYLKGKKFNSLFIDEASQLLEPMSWVPILKCERVIFCGDHFQLPPVIKSRKAEEGGLKITLFEKCMNLENVSALLSTQYRMHNDIMGFSNFIFYDNKLESDKSVSETLFSYSDNDYLLNHAVEFIDTAGCGFEEVLNPESLSLSNPEEAALVWKHLKLLTDQIHTNLPLESQNFNIGIITPYKEQLTLFQNQLSENVADETLQKKIAIKTIDGFQGEERDIIYLSLVRCNNKNEIGFLSDARRTNVALTRAKKKLVIIGDSATLANNPFYKKLIDYCENIGAYKSAWEYVSV